MNVSAAEKILSRLLRAYETGAAKQRSDAQGFVYMVALAT